MEFERRRRAYRAADDLQSAVLRGCSTSKRTSAAGPVMHTDAVLDEALDLLPYRCVEADNLSTTSRSALFLLSGEVDAHEILAPARQLALCEFTSRSAPPFGDELGDGFMERVFAVDEIERVLDVRCSGRRRLAIGEALRATSR